LLLHTPLKLGSCAPAQKKYVIQVWKDMVSDLSFLGELSLLIRKYYHIKALCKGKQTDFIATPCFGPLSKNI